MKMLHKIFFTTLFISSHLFACTDAFTGPIVIPYRDDGYGKGALWDHHLIQKITNHETRICHSSEIPPTHFVRRLKKPESFDLLFGIEDTGKKIPQNIENGFNGGLLYIPGHLSEEPQTSERSILEQKLIKEASLRGQPILAICAGSWQLLRAFGGDTVEVKGHKHSRLMKLGEDGEEIYDN